MPIYALGDRTPTIHPDAFVHPDAVVIGDVRIGADSSVWPGAILRGDYGTILIGERTSIQDGAVVHAVADYPTVVGDDCVVGHLAHLEGCVVHDRTDVPENALAVGVPATIRPDASHVDEIAIGAALYVSNARRYKRDLRPL
jgi:carbonic anhydrase/acetyltransferase-like protein (isoleucine patch superfamily)